MRSFTLLRDCVQWIGLYVISVSLFWYESHDLGTALTFGLMSATCKSLWASMLFRIWKTQPITGTVHRN